jgi:integrase/recombinase XerC
VDTWNQWLAGYATTQRAAQRSSGTVALQRHYLQRLARLHPDPAAVTTTDLETFLAAHPWWQPETTRSARSSLRGFYKWACRKGLLEADPAQHLEPVRTMPPVVRPAPEPVVAAVVADEDPRIALMGMLGAYLGLRCCEIARVHSADLDGDVLWVLGKGRKRRKVIVVHPGLLDRLRGLEGWAFPGRVDGHLSAGHVSRLLSRALADGCTAHQLRSRMATVAFTATRDVLSVGRFLGHSRPETTQRYIALPDDGLRAAALAAA